MEKMNGYPLAGRQIKVGHVTEKGTGTTFKDTSLEESGGGANLNNISRIELMQKLARTDRPPDLPKAPLLRPNIPVATSRSILLRNAFSAEEETERDWDKDLADDVKGECEEKYGGVLEIYVDKESQGEIYIRFKDVEAATKATAGLNGRWFGGRQIGASFISDAMFDAQARK